MKLSIKRPVSQLAASLVPHRCRSWQVELLTAWCSERLQSEEADLQERVCCAGTGGVCVLSVDRRRSPQPCAVCSALRESKPSCSSHLQVWKLKTTTRYAAAAVGTLLPLLLNESAASCFDFRCCIIYCSCILCCCCYLFASSDAQLQARTLNLREHITEKRTVNALAVAVTLLLLLSRAAALAHFT